MRLNPRWLFCLAVMLLAAPALAQDAGTITLEAFTNETFGIQGLAPQGWREAGPGLLARNSGAADFTLLAQQSAAVNSDALMKALLPQLLLTEVPESVGSLETPSLTWALYKVDVDTRGVKIAVDLAVAQGERSSYVVLLQSSPDEYDQLHEQVFLPVVNALAPLAAAPEAADAAYRQEEVTFSSGDHTMAGTLTLPEGDGPFPAVVLVSGSGPQDRDESLAPMAAIKPFRLLAEGLTRAGVAVLRYDDRGVGASTGVFDDATTADFASDTASAIAYLSGRDDINAAQIGVLGHSEGGMVAAMLGASNPKIAFIISLAGPGVNLKDLLLKQNQRVFETSGATQEAMDLQLAFLDQAFDLVAADDAEALEQLIYETALKQVAIMPEEERAALGDVEQFARRTARTQLPQMMSNWWKAFLAYDPAVDWAKTTVPVLAIFGGLDVQVDAEQNAPAVEAALREGGNEDVTVTVIPDMNHLGQKAETGGVDEYGTLEQNFHPDLLPTITGWLLERVDAAGE